MVANLLAMAALGGTGGLLFAVTPLGPTCGHCGRKVVGSRRTIDAEVVRGGTPVHTRCHR